MILASNSNFSGCFEVMIFFDCLFGTEVILFFSLSESYFS
ncbi:hypothetical protein LMG26846_02656 [Achromobacter insuavis]|nr:hypothetical protein LMG26846_02656 [Achromobacter insuavis]